jgi:predicted enzyme involved in methoxymalonyl-ACP biosynthesis
MQCLVVEVSDRFGDYGLVGAMICRAEEDALSVDTMLLSCRALGRRVEHKMLSHLADLARENGLRRVDIPFQPTARNKPAFEFLESVGAEHKEAIKGGYIYRFPVKVASQAGDTFGSGLSEEMTSPQVPAATGTGAQ